MPAYIPALADFSQFWDADSHVGSTPCRDNRLLFTIVCANGAAAEIPVRLLLPPAAAD